MNRFRVNLHPALYFPGDSEAETPQQNVSIEGEKNQLEKITIQELDNLKNEVLGNVSGKRRERINSRLSFDQNDDIWTRNIIEGYGSLITALKENNYFEDKDNVKELEKIKKMYEDEVRRQFRKVVGQRSEKKFERVDQDLFDVNSPNSPANKIYTQLTGAFTVSDVNTTRVSAYEIGGNNDVNQGTEASPTTTKERVDFFAHDLPNCLWEVKDKNFVQKYLPFISKVKAPSIEEKKLITSFVKLVDKLEFTGNNKQNDKPEVLLLKAFEDFGWRTTDQEISKNLEENFNLKLSEEKDMKIFRRVLRAYLETQTTNINENKQHPIFLSILQLIKNNGGFDGTIALFADDVNNYKERQKKEGKEYKEGELIDNEDLKNFIKKLQLQDFASATRLLEKESNDNYFAKTPIVDILADLNNDGEVRYSDRGLTKTGLQFKNTYNMIGEDVALKNLVEMAKLRNQSLGLEIEDGVFGRVEQEIRGKNTELILLLQSVIANPGIDLYSLMLYGPDAAARNGEMYDYLKDQPESSQDPQVQEVAKEISSRIDLSKIGNIDGVEDVITAEGLHQAVAGELYTQYVRGVGLGLRMPFDERVKGVSLNGGFQATENGVNFGLTLAYNKDFNLGNGRSISAGASAGFISMFHVGGGVSVGAAKEWLSEHGVLNKIGGSISFTEIFGVAHVGSAFGGFERDKLEGIEQQRLKIEADFRSKVIGPLLDSISEKFSDKDFDLTQSQNRELVEGVVDEYIGKLLKGDDLKKFTNEDKERLRNNTILYLLNYNKAPINSKNVRDQIAIEMAKDYSYAWAEQRINDVDGKTYLARAGIGASWAWIGAMGVGVLYVSVGLKRQTADMYVDVARTNTIVEALSGSEWTQDMLENFNKSLPEKAKFRLENGFIVVPKEAASLCNININPDMKGKMKKDESGNILLSTRTYMNLPNSYDGTATRYVKVLIGGENERGETFVSMKEVLKNPDAWFTTDVINDLELPGREDVFTEQGLESVLNLLKQQEQNLVDQDLQDFHFENSILSQLEKGNRYKIIIRKHTDENGNSVIEADSPIPVNNGEELQLEYEKTRDLGEMMSTEAGRIADLAYKEALKVTSTRLFLISHDVENRGRIVSRKWPEYVSFANAVKDKDYKRARDIIVAMLPNMDSYINKDQGNNKVNFSAMINDLNKIKDDVELGQAMLSINNIFARVSAVKGGTDGEYHFVRWVNNREQENEMGNIIGPRAEKIKNKINSSDLNLSIKNAYTALIDFAEKYRKAHPEEYKDTSRKGTTLHNAVGINLGNAISIENPLFNPEVYEGSIIDWNDLEFEGKDELKLHALEVMANDKSLMGPILKALNIDANSNYTITNTSDGRISIDFDGINVILGAEMKFGYFAQCVNHMLLLDNITAEVPKEGSSVSFGPSVSGDGNHGEGILRTVTRDVTSGVVIGGTVARRGESYTIPGEEDRGKVDKTDIPGVEETTNNAAGNGQQSGGNIDLS